jgi:hypothetical protein
MNESVEYFLEIWGKPTEVVSTDEATLRKLGRYVPENLIEYWRELGFSVFQEGLMAICNPIDWKPLADEWIAGTELEDLDNFFPILRGAMGQMSLLGARHGYTIALYPVEGQAFVTKPEPAEDAASYSVESLLFLDPDYFAIEGDDFNFATACKRLGSLRPNEIYGFVPVLPLGGISDLAHLKKVDAFAHLSILCQVTGEIDIVYVQ